MKRESGFSYITFAIRVFIFWTMMAGISCYAADDNIPTPTVTMTDIDSVVAIAEFNPPLFQEYGQDTTFQVFLKFHDYSCGAEKEIEIRELDENVIIDTGHEMIVEAYFVISDNLYEKHYEKHEILNVTDGYGNVSFRKAYNPLRTVLTKKALMSGFLELELAGGTQTVMFTPLKDNNFHQKIVVKQDYTGIVSMYVIAFGLLAISVWIGISSSRGSKDKETNRYLSHFTSNLLKYAPEEPSSREEDIFNEYLHDHPNIKITHDTYLDENKTGEYYAYLCKHLSFEERRDFILFLFKLAIDQDGIKNKEWSLLQQAMMGLRMNSVTINYFNQKYGPLRTEYDDYAQYRSSSQTSATHSRALSSDYAALGITSTAGKEEVQRAYHKMALQYHPDLPQNAGKEAFCTQKMTEINEAYERIISTL